MLRKRQRKTRILCTLLAIGLFVTGCQSTPVNVESANEQAPEYFQQSNNSISTRIGDETLMVKAVDEDVVQVLYLPNGVENKNTLVLASTDHEGVSTDTVIDGQKAVMTTDKMIVEIDLELLTITFKGLEGKTIAQEQIGEFVNYNRYEFTYQADSDFYGIHSYGAQDNPDGRLLRNEGGIVRAGLQGNAGAPLIWTPDGYGFLFDSGAGRMRLDEGEMSYSHKGNENKEYFFMVGQPMEMLSDVADLTGHSPMFPKWALGFMHSEWGLDEEEMLATIQGYRERGLPLDNYIMDFDWKAWGEDDYGEFRWNEEKFPSGKSGELAALVGAQGVKMTAIMKPRIHVNTIQGEYASANDFWWPNRKTDIDYFSKQRVNGLDFSKEEVRDWFFENSKLAVDTGFVGWWNDEADERYDSFQHMNMQRALYDGQRSYNDLRVFSINRNFFLGAQRYGYGLWSGDINSGFDAMADQRQTLLSAVMLGEPKWGMDTGGFNGDDPSPENYARWMQFNAFVPIFRVHGREFHQRQPWAFGEQAEAVSKEAMMLRYSLIPYIYQYERSAYENGIGLVRSLVMAYPEDPMSKDYIDGWMFGDSLYVAPVVEEGQTSKEIYLPEGEWIDYFRGDAYEGKQTIRYDLDAETLMDIPLFVKKGSIIPTQKSLNYIGEEIVDTINMNIFPSSTETELNYYDDNGENYSYETGEWFKQKLAVVQKDSTVNIAIDASEGSYNSDVKFYEIIVNGVNAQQVFINDEEISDFSVLKSIYGNTTKLRIPAGEALEVRITE